MQEISDYVYQKDIVEKNAELTSILFKLNYMEEEIINIEKEKLKYQILIQELET